MDNLWQGIGVASQQLGEVNYTPGIDIDETYMPTDQQLNNFTPESSGSYWARIIAYCEEHNCPRSKSSLQHRWGDIQKDTSRFCGFYAEVERKNQSGKSEDDKVKDALQMYEGIVESTFKFIHCWYMLRNEMKWNEWLASMSASNGEQSTELAKASTDATLPPRIDRPNGRDRAKKPRTSSTASSACLEVLQKMPMDRNAYEVRVEAATKEEAKDIASRSDRKLALQEEQLQVQKDQVQIQRELLELQKADREERVMSMDLEKLSPWVQDYYINKQKQISAMSLRGDGSSGPRGQ
ncbi:hypothetical protein PVAP13_5NG550600 [Panicum virgatum]|uniref:No apical meristem-associated C-terminal domain-containing protein n=1 Tax=Panicum virgatum TaxID=38727 RepID=A0A8T0S073_PANVG|nr:hypothetical protein PVAP13_5NG550600 [Panicum virgatum]